MLSPGSFKNGPTSDPMSANSCPQAFMETKTWIATVTCVGIESPVGTGPWMLTKKVDRSDGSQDELVFDKNPNWWGTHGDVETIRVKRYDSSEEVKSALLNGE